MPPKNNVARTIGSLDFDPDQFLQEWSEQCVPDLATNDLQLCIQKAFKLKSKDDYVYHAIASVTLQQVQNAVDAGERNGMHAWYKDEQGQQMQTPSKDDIEAYVQIFNPKTSTVSALKNFASNAKKDSIRQLIGQNLQSKICLPTDTALVLPVKQKKANFSFVNPYYDLWSWSCHNLEWAGPHANTDKTRQSHHILPIFYHHFGCIVPTWDAISLLTQLCSNVHKPKPAGSAQKRGTSCVVEIGSGNGYWTYLLRRHGLSVIAVDNALSDWRTIWISDTIIADGVAFVQNPNPFLPPSTTTTTLSSATSSSANKATPNPGGKGCPLAILLLVYPQVSHNLTANLIRAYTGDAIVVAGTQNSNGYTAFADQTMAEWMTREMGDEFRLVVQVPLPSFAGKDEALFVFLRK